jgi:plastocyanin
MKKLSTFLAGLIIVLGLGYSQDGYAKKWVVTAQEFFFSPASLLNVVVGDTIEWEWVNGMHTTTSMTIPAGAASWDHPLDSGSPIFEYPVTVVGAYAYKCTPHFSLGMIGSFDVTASSGIAEDKYAPVINISPNPFRDNVKIQYDSKTSSLKEVLVYDLTGKIVRTLPFQAQSGFTAGTFDLQDLEKGLYLFKFIDNSDRIIIRRVIRD